MREVLFDFAAVVAAISAFIAATAYAWGTWTTNRKSSRLWKEPDWASTSRGSGTTSTATRDLLLTWEDE